MLREWAGSGGWELWSTVKTFVFSMKRPRKRADAEGEVFKHLRCACDVWESSLFVSEAIMLSTHAVIQCLAWQW